MNERGAIQASVQTPLGRRRIHFNWPSIWLDWERRFALMDELREYLLSRGPICDNEDLSKNRQCLEKAVEAWVRRRTGLLGHGCHQVGRALCWELFGWSALEPHLLDRSVTDIMASAREIWVQRNGQKVSVPTGFKDEQHITNVARKIAHAAGQSLTVGQPFVTCYTRGVRVNLVIPPMAAEGTTIIIRKFRDTRWAEQDYIRAGTLNQEVWRFLAEAMEAGVTGIISGPVGSGKTTLLQSLVAYIPDEEGILVTETITELFLKRMYPGKCVISVVPRLRGHETSRITLEQLFENALHQNMRRFLFGEIRGAETVLVMEAFQTGHSGWTTMHADHPKDAVQRLVEMCLRNHRQLEPAYTGKMVAHAVDLVVQMRNYRVTEVAEVMDYQNGEIAVRPLFQSRKGRWEKTNAPSPALVARLNRGRQQ